VEDGKRRRHRMMMDGWNNKYFFEEKFGVSMKWISVSPIAIKYGKQNVRNVCATCVRCLDLLRELSGTIKEVNGAEYSNDEMKKIN
jgi:hypothetical protein